MVSATPLIALFFFFFSLYVVASLLGFLELGTSFLLNNNSFDVFSFPGLEQLLVLVEEKNDLLHVNEFSSFFISK